MAEVIKVQNNSTLVEEGGWVGWGVGLREMAYDVTSLTFLLQLNKNFSSLSLACSCRVG